MGGGGIQTRKALLLVRAEVEVIMVGHTFLYMNDINHMKQCQILGISLLRGNFKFESRELSGEVTIRLTKGFSWKLSGRRNELCACDSEENFIHVQFLKSSRLTMNHEFSNAVLFYV